MADLTHQYARRMGQPTQRATNYTARSKIEPAQMCLTPTAKARPDQAAPRRRQRRGEPHTEHGLGVLSCGILFWFGRAPFDDGADRHWPRELLIHKHIHTNKHTCMHSPVRATFRALRNQGYTVIPAGGAFLLAAGALKTTARNGYTA